eukprot:13041020-Alexandrium_andersonii.AAC.1
MSRRRKLGMPARSASRGRSAPRTPKAEPADADMRATPDAAPAVVTPAPVAEATSGSDEEMEPSQ